jgi:ribonuclease III
MNEIDKEKIREFLSVIDIEVKELELFKRALTHRSFINEANNNHLHHNERMEFLGDAVLELIVTEHLFARFPERPEGELTSFRAAVVRTESLAETSSELKIGEYLYLSKGEEITGGRNKPYILANTFEAIVGAIYLDLGFEKAKQFVEKYLLNKIDKIVENRLDIDNKSKLQEIAQDILECTPRYELKSAIGPDHQKRFTMAVIINEQEYGVGSGRNKQEAEQNAARQGLMNIERMQLSRKKK